MQRFAFDSLQQLVSAHSAEKGVDYVCRECHGTLRLRGGAHRQSHFYHLTEKGECHQSGKGMVHLQIQEILLTLLPQGEVELERTFPSIARIGDVVWEPQKLVFEVQCSPITAEEAQGRMIDYRSIGYRVVWLLHEKSFNKKRLSAAEKLLREKGVAYFTNLNIEAKGIIYDQIEEIRLSRRGVCSLPFPVDLTHPKPLFGTLRPFPIPLRKRIEQWPIYFKGDVIDLTFNGEIKHPMKALQEKSLARILLNHCKRLYRLALQMCVEACCR